MQRYKDYLTFPNISTINLKTFFFIQHTKYPSQLLQQLCHTEQVERNYLNKNFKFIRGFRKFGTDIAHIGMNPLCKKESGYLTTTRFQTPKQTMKNFEKIKLCISLSQRYFEKSPFVNISVPIQGFCKMPERTSAIPRITFVFLSFSIFLLVLRMPLEKAETDLLD